MNFSGSQPVLLGMDTPTAFSTDPSDPELAAELAKQREKDRELAMWKRSGVLGFENYVRWIVNPKSSPVSHFE